MAELPQTDARSFGRYVEQLARALNQYLPFNRVDRKLTVNAALGMKRGDMQLQPTSRHQHRARDVAGLPLHPIDPIGRYDLASQTLVALLPAAVAVEQPRMPVYVAVLVRQRAPLAMLPPVLEQQLSRDAHVRLLAGEEFSYAMHFLPFRAQIAVQVDLGRFALYQLNKRVGRDRNRVLPVPA